MKVPSKTDKKIIKKQKKIIIQMSDNIKKEFKKKVQ